MVKALIFFLAAIIHLSFSQIPNYYNYSASNGLAGSTVFDIAQDSSGYMWFATGSGLSRFDGYEFISFTTGSGLNSNNINAVSAGEGSQIYAGHNNRGINVIRTSSITSLDSVEARAQNFLYSHGKLYSYSARDIDIIGKDKIQKILMRNTDSPVILQLIENNFKTEFFRAGFFPGKKTGDILVLTTSGIFLCDDTELKKVNVIGAADSVFSAAAFKNGTLIAAAGGTLYFLAADTLNKALKVEMKITLDIKPTTRIQRMFTDSKQNVWITIPSAGFYKMSPDGEISNYGRKFGLENVQATKFYEDFEGNLWVGTFGKGVYCITNTFVKSYTVAEGLCNNNVYEIETGIDGSIFCGTFNGLSVLSSDKWITVNPKTTNDVYYVYKIKKYSSSVYVCASIDYSDRVENFSVNIYNLKFLGFPSYLYHKGRFYAGSWTNIIKVSENPEIDNSASSIRLIGDSLNINRVNEIFADSRSNLWVGTSNGVCRIAENEKKLFKENSVLSSNINAITEDKQSRVFLGGDNGIAEFNLASGELKSFQKHSGYDLSSVSSFAVDSRNKLWIGSNSGLYILSSDTLSKVDKNVGLFSSEIYSLCYDSLRNNLLIGTNSGLSVLDLNAYESSSMPDFKFFLQSVSGGDLVYTEFNNLEFEPEDNNVKIRYAALLYSMPKTAEFEYTLNGNTRRTESNVIEFTSLQPGKYSFMVKAKAPGRKISNPIFLNFYIKPHFTETAGFPLLIFSAIFIIGAFVTRAAFRKVKKKEREKREINTKMNDLRHQALSAMMNPHFIFNSLNAVQHLVNKGKLAEVNEYISSLARLIRKNLDYSAQSYIKLNEEIEKLRLYLEIENLRFNNKFDFEIIAGENINPEKCEIPNMIVQPFVENSIWHGILPLKEKGKIIISFSIDEISCSGSVYKFLTVKIKDNGVGIGGAQIKEGHISKGIKLVEERLMLLSEEMEIPSSVSAQNLSGENSSSAAGTIVTISLPPHLYKM